jgi:hypothetical protein
MQGDVERFLARLYTERAFRAAFLADPTAVGAREGLSAEECRAVASIPPDQLNRAARSFAHKRGTKPRPASLLRRLFARPSTGSGRSS